MSTDGQGTKCCRNIAENYNRMSRVHERYRRQTDDRQTDRRTGDSECDREFTFAKNSFTLGVIEVAVSGPRAYAGGG